MKINQYFTVYTILFMFFYDSCGQEIAQKQCEKYSNNIERIEIQKSIPRSSRQTRHIVGGTRSVPSEFPFMAALGYGDVDDIHWECGGSLISEKFVLTAAHCASHRELGPIRIIRLGTTNLRIPLGQNPAQDIEVRQIKIHPKYSAPIMYNDIALVELKRVVNFSSTVLPACLDTDPRLINVPVIAMGWGRLDFAGDLSDDLMKVTLTLSTYEECSRSYETESSRKLNKGIQPNTQICAGGTGNSAHDTCQGDSGGPLQMESGNKHIIVGITSFGKACGISNIPGVYTKVSAYVPWLESIVWK